MSIVSKAVFRLMIQRYSRSTREAVRNRTEILMFWGAKFRRESATLISDRIFVWGKAPTAKSFDAFVFSDDLSASPAVENRACTVQVYRFTHFCHACKSCYSLLQLWALGSSGTPVH